MSWTTWRAMIRIPALASFLFLTPAHERAMLAVPGQTVDSSGQPNAQPDTTLPAGVKVVWDLNKAYRQGTVTRERICLNGLWRWQPVLGVADSVPADGWGFFKVPGFWPGRTNYIQEDCQTLHVHPAWKNADLRGITAAWYQREIDVPANWAGRRITLSAEYVNSLAIVYVDGKKAGEVPFPAGEVDLTALCRPGGKHVVSLLVIALPLKGVLLSHTDSNAAREVKGAVERRGLCGDMYLCSTPTGARITDVKVDTSVRKGELTLTVALDGLAGDGSYTLKGTVHAGGPRVHEFTTKPIKPGDLVDDRMRIVEKFLPKDRLWDLHTTGNYHTTELSLYGPDGKLADAFPSVNFGFREFWIDGKDFYLNGTRIHLSAVPLDNAQVGARTAGYLGARETLRRLKYMGINCVYTHNYGCEPGSHISFKEILGQADFMGMLVVMSQPHFAHYDWKAADADRNNGYARHAEFYVREAQNHPSVVAYSMSHNATGYDEDMNPDKIDGLADPRKDAWSSNNAKLAMRAEAIVRRLDPVRVIYHHSSGNLGAMHTMNFYLNFAPIQEVSDWFEHWARHGVKPVFPCEYGVPFTWDWTMYRGWYKGERAFGSAKVPWEFCQAEWNAQFLGDSAFGIGELEKKNLRWEAEQFRAGNLWNRWQYPTPVGASRLDHHEVIARYIQDNWRAHRTWGISANSPWEYAAYFKPYDARERPRKELRVDFDRQQYPGFVADFVQPRQGQYSLDLESNTDWMPLQSGAAVIANNQPILAYIGGKGERFTSKDHNYFPGETVEKQLIIINDSRVTAPCECEWTLNLPQKVIGTQKIEVPTGDQRRLPLRFDLPADLKPGRYDISTLVRSGTTPGVRYPDNFAINVLPRPGEVPAGMKLALFDPKGKTAKLLADLKVPCQVVDTGADLTPFDVLIVGREALSVDGPAPDIRRVRDGLKVLLFEQTAKVLEERFGFRVAEYGLRQVFRRLHDHPAVAGVDFTHLRDWRGDATLSSPRLDYTLRPRYGPTVQWCGIDVPRVWRCGCRGNVASVLIEKPARGDFLPILDGGYSLQYTPLVEYREGKGLILFCQLDVTGRTETDPAADAITRNLLGYVKTWKPRPQRPVAYAGNAIAQKHLETAGLTVAAYDPTRLTPDHLLIVGPGGVKQIAADAALLGKWLKTGGQLLALGIDAADAANLPTPVKARMAEHIGTAMSPHELTSPFAGIGPAELHSRDPHPVAHLEQGNGILIQVFGTKIICCQHVPWDFASKQMNHRRTFRRAACLVSRLAANMGAAESTPVLARFSTPVNRSRPERRWLDGLYLDVPEQWDDPYRYFRW